MMKIGLHFFILCYVFYVTAALNPHGAAEECLRLFEQKHISEIDTQRSKNNDIYQDVVINRRSNQAILMCGYSNVHNSLRIKVELVYEPIKTLPVENRATLANAILYEIKTNASGDVCDTSTNITVKEGPLMVKISGNYDQVDHFCCQKYDEGGENAVVFLKGDDFSEYENPTEAITIIDTENVGENHMRWNCTLLTRKGGTKIQQNNLYYYEKAYYSKITWTGFVHIVGAEEEANKLIFEWKDYALACNIAESSKNLTIKEGKILTVKATDSLEGLKFWCERFDKNVQSNNKRKVLEANLDSKSRTIYYKDSTYEEYYWFAAIPVKSLHGEFDCFLTGRDTVFDEYNVKHGYLLPLHKKNCHVRLNVIGSATNRSVSNTKTTTPQTAVTTSAKPKMATVTTPKVTLQAMWKPTSTDAPKDFPAVWIYVSVGLGVVIVVLGAAVLICLYRRQRGRNTTTPDNEHN